MLMAFITPEVVVRHAECCAEHSRSDLRKGGVGLRVGLTLAGADVARKPGRNELDTCELLGGFFEACMLCMLKYEK